jgi:hypothetical protein
MKKIFATISPFFIDGNPYSIMILPLYVVFLVSAILPLSATSLPLTSMAKGCSP